MISISPYGERFQYEIDPKKEKKKIDSLSRARKTVAVQGLGFVGSAMAAALAGAKDRKNNILYNVIGVDLANADNYWKIVRVNMGKTPVLSADKSIEERYRVANKKGNLLATHSEHAYSAADTVIVDVHLDVKKHKRGDPYKYRFGYENFSKAIKIVAENIREDALVIIETTVPPGTTRNIVYPIFEKAFNKRGLDIGNLGLAYSYERVMPGTKYLDSIINFYRVYSGINERSGSRARKFFESFINTKEFPLYEMHSTTAAEMAKVLENSFRAMNIAFIQEWTEFAQKAGVNLFEAVEAIRMRPTHRNIMSPGLGVGGYCLPKDPLFADWSYANFFNGKRPLKMSMDAVATNDLMPDYAFDLLKKEIKSLKGRSVTLLGVTYLSDVADTRNSPSEIFYNRCAREGAMVSVHDPIVRFWQEKNLKIENDIDHLKSRKHDIVVFAVRDKAYLNMSADDILSTFRGMRIIVDANDVLAEEKAKELKARGIKMIGVGKGHWDFVKEVI